MVLRGDGFLLRRGKPEDVNALASIRKEPKVAQRWGTDDVDQIADDLIDKDNVFVIEIEGEVAGAIQFYEEDDPMYRNAAIDLFVKTSRQGQGFGTKAVREVVRYLIEDRGHHRITIDPAADNEPAIRAYQKVGFRAVGILRRYERGPDGTWHDGLLMDLLPEDVTDPL